MAVVRVPSLPHRLHRQKYVYPSVIIFIRLFVIFVVLKMRVNGHLCKREKGKGAKTGVSEEKTRQPAKKSVFNGDDDGGDADGDEDDGEYTSMRYFNLN